MLKSFIASLALLLVACTPNPPKEKITLIATQDFTLPSDTGLYNDEARQALAIDAANPTYRDIMLGVSRSVDWVKAPKAYDIDLHYMAEKDGESRYELWVNDDLVKSAQAVETDLEFESHITQWNAVTLSTNDIITVKANAVTNGKIPEGDGTAYSRGRWVKLELTPIR